MTEDQAKPFIVPDGSAWAWHTEGPLFQSRPMSTLVEDEKGHPLLFMQGYYGWVEKAEADANAALFVAAADPDTGLKASHAEIVRLQTANGELAALLAKTSDGFLRLLQKEAMSGD